MTDMVWFSKL